jgi:transaldolase/glucose-6-phosphate isomerase
MGGLAVAVERRLSGWDREGVGRRVWERDVTVWAEPGTPEIENRLGWLRLPTSMAERVDDWVGFADTIDDVDDVVLCGMGGSSLAPEVFDATLRAEGRPRLAIADSTHPDAVAALTDRLDPGRTLFIVSSKSGGTLETLSLFRHFWAWRSAAGGRAGDAFVAVTDPGSTLAALADERGFRRTFLAPPDVGGRFSALTDFGMVPAALVGVDVGRVLDGAAGMAAACGPGIGDLENPGLWLGAMLGEAALAGRDKATFVVPPELAGLGAWLEQLVAESTGKEGTGIVPVVDEPLRAPGAYGDDRIFVAYRMDGSVADPRLDALEAAGHPVVRIPVDQAHAIGAEMFRAELATAAAGAVLGINPFDQPDVEAAKASARGLMDGDAPAPDLPPRLDADALTEVLGALGEGGYVAVQAYLPGEPPAEVVEALRSATTAPVTVGIGPRFLHSTGQLHKGGRPGCVALQLVDEPSRDLPIPETDLTFGRVIAAQAAGDAEVLRGRGRMVVRRSVGKKT